MIMATTAAAGFLRAEMSVNAMVSRIGLRALYTRQF